MSFRLDHRALIRRAPAVAVLAPVLVIACLGGSAHAAIAGLERVSASGVTGSTESRSVTVSCPTGKRVLGAAGGMENGGGGQVMLRQVRPDAALTSVTVHAQEDQNGFADSWGLRSYAICAPPPAGLERVAATSPTNSTNKSVVARCPTGKRLLGTGGELTGAPRQVSLNDIVPGAELGAVTVFALEDDDGTPANWSVTAYAICANPVAGGERRVATSPTGSSDFTAAAAPCPTGKQVTGLGGEVAGGGGDVLLHALVLDTGLTLAQTVAFEDEDGTTANWFVRTFAICAAVAERVVGPSVNDSIDKGALASCPAGKQVTGTGGDVTGGGGQVVLDGIVPNAGLTDVTVFGLEDQNGFAGSWSLRSYAICAPPMPGLELISFTSAPASPGNLSVATPPCSAGKRVVGVGGGLNGGNGEVVLTKVRPAPDLTTAFVEAAEDDSGFSNSWSLTAYAICATTPPGLEAVTATSDPGSDPAGITATCPIGKTLLGTGAEIEDGIGQVVLDDVRPNALLTNVTVTGLEDETGFDGDWFVSAHAICANP
jgi:hypothetical protein